MTGTVLILGGRGRFGRHAAEAFWNAGWRVTLFRRGGDLISAAQGTDLIVNGWNPPYPRWAADLPGQTEQVIAAARASGATILQAANLYVYGAGSPELLRADTPHRAQNPLGRLRIETEALLRDSGLPVILLRAGDFLDTCASGNWFDRVIAASLGNDVLTYPGDPDVAHAWAFLPDLARAAVQIAERRERLPRFTDMPFPGMTLSGAEMAAQLSQMLGQELRVRRMSWLPLHLARPAWPLARRLLEMRYLWSMPHRLDPAPFRALCPEFRDTPVEDALRLAVAGLRADPASRAQADGAGRQRAA
ncbi:epimerase [Salipiger abyssi]|uniref:epimerase n=1 Tax=Salipiger abyssi TaxID=1250539 RepID=UPI001A8C76F4|nr:epimerase [Salipiger abyssi]MBN9888696.1 epimerase [Salipiger abyssi]